MATTAELFEVGPGGVFGEWQEARGAGSEVAGLRSGRPGAQSTLGRKVHSGGVGWRSGNWGRVGWGAGMGWPAGRGACSPEGEERKPWRLRCWETDSGRAVAGRAGSGA